MRRVWKAVKESFVLVFLKIEDGCSQILQCINTHIAMYQYTLYNFIYLFIYLCASCAGALLLKPDPSTFCFSYFSDMVSCFCLEQVLDHDSSSYGFQPSWDHKHHAQLID
jgi:hypothetical protein